MRMLGTTGQKMSPHGAPGLREALGDLSSVAYPFDFSMSEALMSWTAGQAFVPVGSTPRMLHESSFCPWRLCRVALRSSVFDSRSLLRLPWRPVHGLGCIWGPREVGRP